METAPNETISLMVLGIDDLRHINDRYDRAFGDEVIRFVAQRIQSALPEEARVYRLDGDEFAVIINDDVNVLRGAYAQLGGMFQRQHDHEGRKFYCTLSGGIAQYPGDAETYESLVKYADYALEYAKGHGKKRCVNFSQPILAERTRELELMELLRDSVENGFKGSTCAISPRWKPPRDGSWAPRPSRAGAATRTAICRRSSSSRCSRRAASSCRWGRGCCSMPWTRAGAGER